MVQKSDTNLHEQPLSCWEGCILFWELYVTVLSLVHLIYWQNSAPYCRMEILYFVCVCVFMFLFWGLAISLWAFPFLETAHIPWLLVLCFQLESHQWQAVSLSCFIFLLFFQYISLIQPEIVFCFNRLMYLDWFYPDNPG